MQAGRGSLASRPSWLRPEEAPAQAPRHPERQDRHPRPARAPAHPRGGQGSRPARSARRPPRAAGTVDRRDIAPTWGSAFKRGLFGAAIFFLLFWLAFGRPVGAALGALGGDAGDVRADGLLHRPVHVPAPAAPAAGRQRGPQAGDERPSSATLGAMDVRMLTVGQVAENCFVLRRDGSDRGLIVDPGEEAERILHVVDELGIGIDAILVTHTPLRPHRRRRAGRRGPPARRSTAPRSRCRCSPTSWPTSRGRASARTRATTPTRRSPAARSSSSPGFEIDVVFTPGHSPGHVTYAIRDEAALFCGDVLFQGSVGRVDLPGGDWPTLLESIRGAGRRLSRGDDRLSRATWGSPRSAPSARPIRSWPSSRVRFSRDEPSASRPRGGPSTSCPPRAGARAASIVVAAELFARAGYGRIETPAFEDTELFARGVGEGTDIVHKEMFTFTDQGDRSADPAPGGRPRRSAAPTSSTGCTGCRSR